MNEFVALVGLAGCLASAAAPLGSRLGRGSPGRSRAGDRRRAECHQARLALRTLGPTIGLLAALLIVAEGCARAGLYDAAGASMARRSGTGPRRLLALVFAAAALTTANLLALSAAGLSFTHFAALMVLPWLAAVGVEWVVLTRAFAADLRPGAAVSAQGEYAPWPRFAAIVVALALAGDPPLPSRGR